MKGVKPENEKADIFAMGKTGAVKWYDVYRGRTIT